MSKQIDELMALADLWIQASHFKEVGKTYTHYVTCRQKLRTALEAALGQPQAVPASNGDQSGLVSTSSPKPGEPVACVIRFSPEEREPQLISWNRLPDGTHHLYTAPPAQTKRLDSDESRLTPPPRLSDEQISDIAVSTPPNVHTYGRAVETAVRKQLGYD